MNFNRERIRVEVKEIEKYIQIYELSEATENETVCACYPESCKNVSGKINAECMLKAEKDAMEGKCKLLVWRTVYTPDEIKNYTLTQREVDQIVVRYNNAKTAMREYQEQNNPDYKLEYGRALALESVLEMIGFDFQEMRRKYLVEGK